MAKILEIKETVLDKKSLEEYLSKIAADNIVINRSQKDTYPIPRLKKNLEYIELVYTLLNEHVKLKIPIHPAGEWILDNFYIISESGKNIIKNLKVDKYIRMPGLADSGFARIFVLANEIVSNTDGKINQEELQDYLMAYQSQKNLNMEEIWNIGIFIQISLIEKIRKICERIFISQMQKYKVQNMIERLIENKKIKPIKMSTNGKYPFIEYMSYSLKRYGKKGQPYLDAFEEQVNKMGMTISEVINREHFDIAVRKLSIKNAITSIKLISRIDINQIFRNVDEVERILNQDPAGVYINMTEATKSYYLSEILRISRKTKLSEIFIAEEVLVLSKKSEDDIKKKHVGYYIIDEGKNELIETITNKKIFTLKEDSKAKMYTICIYLLAFIISVLAFRIVNCIAVLLIIPIINSATHIIQYIVSRHSKVRMIPKIELKGNIPEECATMCIMPEVIKNSEDVSKAFKNLEVYYLANQSRNLYFTLLGDCSASNTKEESEDINIINEGKKICEKLNKKYSTDEPIFFFMYRKREWSESEKCFMGWERKRGMINKLNEFLITGKSDFRVNTCEKDKIKPIKYVITIDSDTRLILDSVSELVGAMCHILNKPEIDKIRNIVVKGHAIIQPRVAIDLVEGRKSLFTRLFSDNSGIEMYTNAVSDVYQDLFNEGTFTGKGIYDLHVFYNILKDAFPENTILSHDLLEGNFLRCGLATDILMIDGYPSNYESYKIRKHRWIRGDIQILRYLRSNLNFIAKYKIWDNLIRNLNEVCVFLAIFLGMCFFNIPAILVSLVIFAIPTILKLINIFINQKDGEARNSLFVLHFSDTQKVLFRYIIDVMLLPDIANVEFNAIIKSIYRMTFSHSFLLEWTTASEADKSPNSLKTYSRTMLFSIIMGILTIIYPIGILWAFSPIVMYLMSKKESKKEVISKEKQKYLTGIAKDTWQFFKDNMVNNLITDNYQEGRRNRIVDRTSSTNIGLELLAIISAFDMGFESLDYTANMLKNVIDTITKLPKWNGHLYNWYNIYTLEVLKPEVVSTVDSGNFVGCLYVAKQFAQKIEDTELLKRIDKIIENTDFSKLYEDKLGLFSIGYNCSENKLIDSYYDLLASEARQTSIIAIAKKDVPRKHWTCLGRTLTTVKGYKGLISWGGTAFEYLMPNLIIPTFESSLLDESCRLLVFAQKEYARKLGVPWGISESAFNLKDFYGNYQYKTFGIPWLGLKRGLENEVVISPYSVAISYKYDPNGIISNFNKLQDEGARGKYGFYESIDYIQNKKIVKTYMAHHQAMLFVAINNLLNNEIMQDRFMENPEMKATEILLQEKMPQNVVIDTGKTEVKKIKYHDYEENAIWNEGSNVLSTHEYSKTTFENGSSLNKIDEIILLKDQKLYIKDIDSMEILDFSVKNKSTTFTAYSSEMKLGNDKLSVDKLTTIAPDIKLEINEITISNKTEKTLNLELTALGTPIIATKMQHDAHPAFDNMFIKFYKKDDNLIITRKIRNNNEKNIFYGITIVADDNEFEYEIDKEKIISRGNKGIPDCILESLPFSSTGTNAINPIVAIRKIVHVPAQSKKKVYIIQSAEYEEHALLNNLEEYKNEELLERVYELSKAQTDAETRYLGIVGANIEIYQKMIRLLCYSKKQKCDEKIQLKNENLWKYGISGDYPLLAVEIHDLNEIYVIRDVVKAYEYMKSKNVKIEVVIISRYNVDEELLDCGVRKYLNQREGIYVLYNIKNSETKMLKNRAKLVVDSHYGSLARQVKDINEIRYEEIPAKENNKKTNIIDNHNKLKEWNGYGGFSEDGKEYWIIQDKNNRLPLAWSNIMANEHFGTVTTDSGGGYTWYINSKTNRITKFDNDSYMDNSSEKIYISANQSTWSIALNDKPGDGIYTTIFGYGYAKYLYENKYLKQECIQYVARDDSAKISIIKLKNISQNKLNVKVKYDVDFQLGEKEDDADFIVHKYKKQINMIIIQNMKNPDNIAYIACNNPIDTNGQSEVILKEGEERTIVYVLGCEKNEMDVMSTAAKFTTNYDTEFIRLKEKWKDIVSKVISQTPMESFNIMNNGWLVYQTIVSRIYARTGFYQSSGGYGFRDQLQDCIGMKFVDPQFLKDQILLCASKQFEQGDVLHWWHEDSKLGIRTRFSDDMLWLVYAVLEYVQYTGDLTILSEKVGFLNYPPLKDNEVDRVSYYNEYGADGTILEHCIKAISYAMNLGTHNLPLMKSGDWNDGMNLIGYKGKGESVWLGFFLYHILDRMIVMLKKMILVNPKETVSKEVSICLNDNNENHEVKPENIQDVQSQRYEEIIQLYLEKMNILRKALNTYSWDGLWYKRAFNDEGQLVGSISNAECKIDSVSQSWAVISQAGDNDKAKVAIESGEKYLVDDENNLIKLLAPALENTNLGYISSYPKGIRENGGQYTHAAIWFIIAEVLLGNNNKAMELYKKINPVEHTNLKEKVNKYKVEPYSVVADIYSENNYAGRGGWTWYTGSSSWMYRLQVEYILGIHILYGKMKIKPAVPDNWIAFHVEFRYKQAIYKIDYEKNKQGKETTMFLDGKEVDSIELQEKGKFNVLVKF